MEMKRQIVTMGGGGFSMEPDNPKLDHFFFGLSNKPKPKVCFVPTASGDSQDYIDRFYMAMKGHEVEPSHLSLFNGPTGSLRDFVMEKDVIYVGGGNTRNLLVLWKEWELDKIFWEAYQKGVVLGGISAGSLCWYSEGVTDSIPGTLSALKCLGYLKESHSPHYDGETERRPSYQRLLAQGMKPGFACDDGVAGYFANEELVEFVSSRPSALAYRLHVQNSKVIEEPITPRRL